MTIFLAGTRVKYSRYGMECLRPQVRNGVPPEDRRGTVQQMTRGGYAVVIWDGQKTRQQFHPNFLEAGLEI